MRKFERTPVKTKAKQIAPLLNQEIPDYNYLRELFRYLRKELKISVPKKEISKQAITFISVEELKKFYSSLDQDDNLQNKVIIKTLLYTGIRVSELVNLLIEDVDFEKCQIHIQKGIRGQKRDVLFPKVFKEELKAHIIDAKKRYTPYFFESSWRKPYSARGIRKIMALYSQRAGLKSNISPNTLRKFFLHWLKEQELEDSMIQPYSGLSSRQSLEKYDVEKPRNMENVQSQYEKVIKTFPV